MAQTSAFDHPIFAHWAATHAQLRPPISEIQLREVEAQYGFPLPPDCLRYARIADGMYGFDDRFFTLWGSHDWLSEPALGTTLIDGQPIRVFSFADYLVVSHTFDLVLDGPRRGAVAVSFAGIIAESITDFFDRYFTDPDAIYVHA